MLPAKRHALRAISWGSFAAASPALLLSLPAAVVTAITNISPAMLLVGFFPWLVSVLVVAPAFIILGLPLSALLRRCRAELRRTYLLVGLATGVLLPIPLVLALEGPEMLASSFIFSFFGALGGSVTGYVWGDWREKAATVDSEMLRDAFN